MSAWSSDQLTRLGSAEELQLASRRSDGSLRPYTTMWVVRVGDDAYVRSAYGATNPWYVRAKKSGNGRVRAGGVESDVDFVEASADSQLAIDAAYHSKYDRYGQAIVGSVVGEHAWAVTIRLSPTADIEERVNS